MKRIDDKKQIIQQLNQMIETFDDLQIITLYLKKIVEESDSDKDILEIELDLPIICNKYSINGDTIFRFKKEINNLYSKMESVKYLKITKEDLINTINRINERSKK
jgi:hypothetical protein